MATKTEIEKAITDLSLMTYNRSVERFGDLGSVYLATRIAGETGEFCKELQRLGQPINRESERWKKVVEENPNVQDQDHESIYHNKTAEDAVVELADIVSMCMVAAQKMGCHNFGAVVVKKFNEVSKKWESPILIK